MLDLYLMLLLAFGSIVVIAVLGYGIVVFTDPRRSIFSRREHAPGDDLFDESRA